MKENIVEKRGNADNHTIQNIDHPERENFEKHCERRRESWPLKTLWEKEKMLVTRFSPFLTMISTL